MGHFSSATKSTWVKWLGFKTVNKRIMKFTQLADGIAMMNDEVSPSYTQTLIFVTNFWRNSIYWGWSSHLK